MKNLSAKLLSPTLLTFLGIVLLAASSYTWWRLVYNAPANVFESMLNNSLRLQGVSRTVEQGGEQETDQVSRLSLVPRPVVQADTTLYQLPDTTVVTQSIGTPYDDYVRYTRVDTSQTNQDGQAIDFSNILNVWGRAADPFGTGQTDGELYAEAVLGVVPFGDLDPNQRQELLDIMLNQGVYDVDYDNVKRQIIGGRPQYVFPVEIDPEAYIKLLKRYAELTGLNNLSEIDPSVYASAESIPFTLTVDVWSRQLTEISYDTGDRVEKLSGHNASQDVTLPADPISVDELQERLQSLQ